MIAIIETTMGSISHEVFNAGMIYQIHSVYPDEQIVYFCEKEQLKAVKRILDNNGCITNIKFITINQFYVDFCRESIEGTKKEYINILKKCFNVRFAIILSLLPVNVGLVNSIVKRFNNIKFGVCIHGYIENILPCNNIKIEKQLNIISSIKEYQNNTKALNYFKRNLKDMAQMQNCNIILYSNMYKKYKDCIDLILYQNIKVLNLPYLFTYDKKKSIDNKKFKIGIMASSMAAKDNNCKKIIQYMNKQVNKIQYPYQFMILNYSTGDNKNTVRILKPGRSRKDVETFMNMCDWMLIPYDENKYILSSSGVLFDCIEAERPFFALGSPTFFKAIDAGCGIQECSIEALVEKMIWQINNKNPDYEKYCINIRRLKKRMEKENREQIEMIFGKIRGQL